MDHVYKQEIPIMHKANSDGILSSARVSGAAGAAPVHFPSLKNRLRLIQEQHRAPAPFSYESARFTTLLTPVLNHLAVLPEASHNAASQCPYAVAPLYADLYPGVSGNGGTITVSNLGASFLEVQVRVLKFNIAEDGSEETSPDYDSFGIDNSHQTIPARETRTVHFEWKGGPVGQSQSFYIEIDQTTPSGVVPSSHLESLYNFKTIVNVSPRDGKSSLDVDGVRIGLDRGFRRRPVLVVSDSGDVYAKLSDAQVFLKSGPWSMTLSPEDLRRLIGLGIVQPHHRRQFMLPVDIPSDLRDLSAEIKYERR